MRRDAGTLENPENVGIRIPLDLLKQIFPAWHDHRIMPHKGGLLDQDADIMDALDMAEYGVAWWMQNLRRKALDDLPELD